MHDKPTEQELHGRISRHLSFRGASDAVVLIWRGYLAGLLEWGLIDLAAYERLMGLLPRQGAVELDEVFSGERVTPEREAELKPYSDISE